MTACVSTAPGQEQWLRQPSSAHCAGGYLSTNAAVSNYQLTAEWDVPPLPSHPTDGALPPSCTESSTSWFSSLEEHFVFPLDAVS